MHPNRPIRDEPPWMATARAEVGQLEIPGPEHNPRILAYHATTKLRATTDEVHWCSAFVNWVLLQHKITGTNSAAAISWAKWGFALEAPRIGAVAIVPRNDPNNPHAAHVGFVAAYTPFVVQLLAGNQGNRVSLKPFSRAAVKHYRYPFQIEGLAPPPG